MASDYKIVSAQILAHSSIRDVVVPIPWEVNNPKKDISVFRSNDSGVSVFSGWIYDGNGNVCLTVPANDKDYAVYIFRAEAAEMLASLTSSGEVKVSDIIAQLAKNVRCLEQFEEGAKTGLRSVDEISPIPTASYRAGKLLSFDSNGQPVCSIDAYTKDEILAAAKPYVDAAAASAKSAGDSAKSAGDSATLAGDYVAQATTLAATASASATAAEKAQADAEKAMTDASGSATSAQAAAVEAAKSATACENAKDAAASSATFALDMRNQASMAADAAEGYSVQAETASDTAIEQATTAASSALTAQQAATQAETASDTAIAKANDAATSAQTAQQAAENATEISDPEGWRTNTRDLITDLANSKSNIGLFNFGAAGGCLQATDNPMYGVLDQSHCMTLELDEYWNLDSIPTPWLNFSGNIYASGGVYYGIGWQLGRSSAGLNRLGVSVGNGQSGGLGFGASDWVENIFGGTNSAIPAGKYVICLCIHIGNGTTSDVSTAKVYINGTLAYTYNSSTAININSVKWTQSTKFGFFDIGNTHLTTNFATNGCFIGKASRFAVFNFDMSASDAPYTVADYYNGKAIPVAMQSSLNITWNATDVPIYSTMASGITSIPAGSVGYSNRPATIAYEDDGSISWTASTAASGFPHALAYRFKKAAFGSGKLKVNIGTLTSTLPSDTRFFVNYFNASGTASSSTRKEIGTSGGSFEFDYKDGCIGVSIQIGANTEWAVGNSLKVASVSVVVDGCVVASADYAIARNATTKLVKDITGNGNDLTVYGDVIGDKDAAIAAFVDELKTQISQNS